MALPKLNSSPSYELTIPSSGQLVHFRPFLVKEQKNLLIALETQDRKALLSSIIRTIESCVEETIKSKLTTFDVDYMFTKLRAKSVGETVDLSINCESCEEPNTVTIDIDSVQVKNPVQDNVVKLSEEISVEMAYPSYHEFLENTTMTESKTQAEILFELMLVCMKAVLTDEERISLKDESREEIINFVENMTTDQYSTLMNYVQNIPYAYKDVEFTCSKCNTVNNRTLQGMDDFF